MLRTCAALSIAALLAAGPVLALAAWAGKPRPQDEYAAVLEALPEGDAGAQYKLALWCLEKGMPTRARRHFRAVVELDADHEGARRRLGYAKEGERWVTARERTRIEYESKRAAAAEDDPEALLALAEWCRAQRLFVEADEHYGALLEIDPDNAAAQQALEAPAVTAAERLVARFVSASDAERRKLLPELRRLDKIPAEDIARWIYFVRAHLKMLPKHTAGEGVATLHHPEFPIRYRVLVKRDGDALSMLVLLHSGGPDRGVNDMTWEQLQYFAQAAPFDLVAMPRVWDDSTGAGWVLESGPLAVEAMIREILRSYPIDTDRVHLSGASMGGYGTCFIGCLEADRFASLGVLAAGYSEGNAKPGNLMHLPITVHIGEQDVESDHIGSSRALEKQLDALVKQEPGLYAYHYREYPGVGHQLPAEAYDAAFRWGAQYRREPNVPHVVWEPFTHDRYPTHKHYFYWLAIDSPRTGMRLDGKILGNSIEVRTRQVSRFSVMLNDSLVDLGRSVTVSVDGRSVHSGRLAPSLSAIVESYTAKEDPQLIYTHRIDIGR